MWLTSEKVHFFDSVAVSVVKQDSGTCNKTAILWALTMLVI